MKKVLEDITLAPTCKCCLENLFTNYLKIIDIHKLVETRKRAMINQSMESCRVPLPKLLGSFGEATYFFDMRVDKDVVSDENN